MVKVRERREVSKQERERERVLDPIDKKISRAAKSQQKSVASLIRTFKEVLVHLVSVRFGN